MQNNNSTSEAYEYLDNSPMFKFSLSSKELFHSNFLEWLYNVDKNNFKKLIQKMAGLEKYDWPDNWLVKREYNNFDLCIVEPNAKNNGEETEIEEEEFLEEAENKAGDNDNNNEDGNFRILFVIENKVKSIPYREQLIRYAKEANSINEAYWKSIGKDVLTENDYYEDCVVVENNKWVLKRGKYREGRKVKWRESIELIPADNRKEGNSSVKNFLTDYEKNKGTDCKGDGIKILEDYGFKEYQLEVDQNKWVLKKGSYTEGKKINWSSEDISLNNKPVKTEKDSGSGKTAFLNDFANVQSKSCPVYYILLSLASKFPGDDEIEDGSWKLSESVDEKSVFECNWHVFYYSNYYTSIQDLFISDDSTDLNGLIIKDYCTFLENLTNLVTVWQQDYEDYGRPFLSDDSDNYKYAKKHRIHDLYQKLKFSYLCADLFNKIKTKYQEQNRYTVYPSNQSGLFKEKKDSPLKPGDNYICVNYTYLHGAPLLEINIHPKCDPEKEVELYYAIQVQGKAYEKGIQVKKNDVAETMLSHSGDGYFSKTIWDSLTSNSPDKQLKLKVENWMNLDSNGPQDKSKPNNEEDKKTKLYNKYDMSDGSYIYQSQKHNKAIIQIEKASINKVIDCMLKDLAYVVDSLR